MPTRMVQTNYYYFRQNNPRGRFDVDDKVGHVVIFEALDHQHANARATELGMELHDGWEGSVHWDRLTSSDEGYEEPHVSSGTPLAEYDNPYGWGEGELVHVYHFDGRHEVYHVARKTLPRKLTTEVEMYEVIKTFDERRWR